MGVLPYRDQVKKKKPKPKPPASGVRFGPGGVPQGGGGVPSQGAPKPPSRLTVRTTQGGVPVSRLPERPAPGPRRPSPPPHRGPKPGERGANHSSPASGGGSPVRLVRGVGRAAGGAAAAVGRSTGGGTPAPAPRRTGRTASGGGGAPAPARGTTGGSASTSPSPGKAAERSTGKKYGKTVTKILKKKVTGEKPKADAVNRALARFRETHAWARDAGNAAAAKRIAMRLVNHKFYGAKPGQAVNPNPSGGPDPVPGGGKKRKKKPVTVANFNRF